MTATNVNVFSAIKTLFITLLVDVSDTVKIFINYTTHTRDSSESVSEEDTRPRRISDLKHLTDLISP